MRMAVPARRSERIMVTGMGVGGGGKGGGEGGGRARVT